MAVHVPVPACSATVPGTGGVDWSTSHSTAQVCVSSTPASVNEVRTVADPTGSSEFSAGAVIVTDGALLPTLTVTSSVDVPCRASVAVRRKR